MPTYCLHLFLVRLWRERLDQERFEWRGQVKNTSTGEVRYFRNAASLYDALLVLLNNPAGREDAAEDWAANQRIANCQTRPEHRSRVVVVCEAAISAKENSQ